MRVFSKPTRQDLLGVYLNDHLMGAAAGAHMFARAARGHSDPEARTTLRRLTDEVSEDRDALVALMRDLGVTAHAYRMVAGRVGERLGRLKMNGTVVSRSPLTDLVELEALKVGVHGKLSMWTALASVAEADPRIDATRVEGLIQRAERQLDELETLRRQAVGSALAS